MIIVNYSVPNGSAYPVLSLTAVLRSKPTLYVPVGTGGSPIEATYGDSIYPG